VAWAIAFSTLPHVNRDARFWIGLASVLLPGAAALASVAAAQGRARLCGALLVLSAASPTYFALALNIPALVVGVLLVVLPDRNSIGDRVTP
jgi:hypothetical protein